MLIFLDANWFIAEFNVTVLRCSLQFYHYNGVVLFAQNFFWTIHCDLRSDQWPISTQIKTIHKDKSLRLNKQREKKRKVVVKKCRLKIMQQIIDNLAPFDGIDKHISDFILINIECTMEYHRTGS